MLFLHFADTSSARFVSNPSKPNASKKKRDAMREYSSVLTGFAVMLDDVPFSIVPMSRPRPISLGFV